MNLNSSGTRECKDLNIDVICDHRSRSTRQTDEPEETYVLNASFPADK
jgi:hypothetical protein